MRSLSAALLLTLVAPSAHAGSAMLEAGPSIGSRDLSFRDAGQGSSGLRDYQIGAAAGLGLRAELYPVRAAVEPGLAFAYFTTTNVVSDTSRNQSIPSIWTRLDAAVRLRLLLGRRAVVGLGAGITKESFTFSDKTSTLPEVRYLSLRVGLDARVNVGPVAVLVGAGVLPSLSMHGVLETEYVEPKTFGLDGLLGVAYPLREMIEVRLTATHTRYGTTWAKANRSIQAASGATDAFSRLQVSLAFSP